MSHPRHPPEVLRVGLVQHASAESPDENVARAVSGVREAASRGAQLVVLQELFRSPYFCRREDPAFFDLAESIPGPSTELFGALAKELGVSIVTSLFERRAPGLYHNTAAVIGATGELVGIYRKSHIPDDPCFLEKFYFTPGDTGFVALDVGAALVGPLVCWDQWYPEAARLTALRGAQLLVYPTAIGWLEPEGRELGEAQLDAWETLQRSHAIANGVFVAAVNRVGREDEIEFWGSSFVADPFGRVLARASRTRDEVLLVDCDLGLIESVRRDWPFFRDRRIDLYDGLDRRYLDGPTRRHLDGPTR